MEVVNPEKRSTLRQNEGWYFRNSALLKYAIDTLSSSAKKM